VDRSFTFGGAAGSGPGLGGVSKQPPRESGPEVELVRATVKGNKRQLESIRSMFGQDIGTERKSIAIQRWEIAATVYRFTLGEPLPPGEYALAEILPGGMIFLFGIWSGWAQAPAKK